MDSASGVLTWHCLANWITRLLIFIKAKEGSQVMHNVVSTSIQRNLNVMNVRWTLFSPWRIVSVGIRYISKWYMRYVLWILILLSLICFSDWDPRRQILWECGQHRSFFQSSNIQEDHSGCRSSSVSEFVEFLMWFDQLTFVIWRLKESPISSGGTRVLVLIKTGFPLNFLANFNSF